MATAISSPFATLPDDLQQRVLAGIPLDDQQATAAACKAFRAVIHGPKFLALRRRYGFAEGGVVVVESRGHRTAPYMSLKIITSGITTIIFQGLRVSSYGSTVTTDGGSRLFVSESSEQILEVNVSSRRWKRLATLPQEKKGTHCCEWHNGILYVAGGLGSGRYFSRFLDSVFAFSEATGLWEELPPMPHACCQAASGIIGNQLFIAGGQSNPTDEGSELLTLQIYDIATRTWRLGPPLPDKRAASHGLVVDGKLCLVAWCMPLLVYDPKCETWTESESYPSQPSPLQHACVHNGHIIVFLKDKTLERAADGSWAPCEGAADLDPPDGWGPHNAFSASVLLG